MADHRCLQSPAHLLCGRPVRSRGCWVDGPPVGMAYPPMPKSFAAPAPSVKMEPVAESPLKVVQSEIASLRHRLAALEAEVPDAAAKERRIEEMAAEERRIAGEAAEGRRIAEKAREERPAPTASSSSSSAKESSGTRSSVSRSSQSRRHKGSRERRRSERHALRETLGAAEVALHAERDARTAQEK